MTYTIAIAQKLVEAGGLIDLMEADTTIPKTQRVNLAAYQAKLAVKSTSHTDDLRFLHYFTTWLRRQKITA